MSTCILDMNGRYIVKQRSKGSKGRLKAVVNTVVRHAVTCGMSLRNDNYSR